MDTPDKPKKPRTNKYPAEGVTLEMKLNKLVEFLGWELLGDKIRINCFNTDPSIKSSLKFLRKTEWARKKVESLYNWCEEIDWDIDEVDDAY